MSFYKSFRTVLAPGTMLAPLAWGCATAGLIYEDVGHPPIHITAGPDSGGVGWDSNLNASSGGRALVKKGVACSQDILKLFAWGDATQAAAAKQGGVTEVVGVDFDNTAILGVVYTRNCTVVYGKGPAANAEAAQPVASPIAVDAPATLPVPADATPPPARAPVGMPTVEAPAYPPPEPPAATKPVPVPNSP